MTPYEARVALFTIWVICSIGMGVGMVMFTGRKGRIIGAILLAAGILTVLYVLINAAL